MGTYTPPGWPAGVHPPGSDDFESTAIGWLLEVVPPDYRLHGVLRRYPVALATMARHHSKACVEGARQGYRTARTELADVLPPHAVDTVLAAYRKEGARLAATARAVGLVERALRGEVFTPKMSFPAADGPQAGSRATRMRAVDPEIPQPGIIGPEMAGAGAAGPEPARTKAAGPAVRRPETAGLEMAGLEAAGLEAAGLETAGAKMTGRAASARANGARPSRAESARGARGARDEAAAAGVARAGAGSGPAAGRERAGRQRKTT